MAHFPQSCKLCPNMLLSDDGHNRCHCAQHLKDALTDPWVHCSMLHMSERQPRLAELDHNSSVSLSQRSSALWRAQKHCALAAAGAPQTKRKTIPRTDASEHLLSKTVASLSSWMSDMKCLFQSLQPMVSAVPTENTLVDEVDFQLPHTIDLDAQIGCPDLSASNSYFHSEELVEPAMQAQPPSRYVLCPACLLQVVRAVDPCIHRSGAILSRWHIVSSTDSGGVWALINHQLSLFRPSVVQTSFWG